MDDELGFSCPLEILQGTGPVAVQGAVCSQVLPGKRSQDVRGFGRNYARGDLARFPVPHTDDDGFSIHPSFPQSLVGVLVALLSAYVSLVDLASPASELLLIRPSFADAVGHEPGRFLRYVEVPVQLHAAYPLQTGQVQVDGDHPFLQGDLGVRQHRSGADAEVVPAVAAPKGPVLAVGAFGDHAVTAAMGTVDLPAPPGFFEPAFRYGVVGEFLEQLDQGNAFSVVPSRPFGDEPPAGFGPASQESLQSFHGFLSGENGGERVVGIESFAQAVSETPAG